MEKLDIDEEVADVQAPEGLMNLEDIAYVPKKELESVEGFDDVATELQRRRIKHVQAGTNSLIIDVPCFSISLPKIICIEI